MNMKTGLDSSILRKNSLLFWCTLVVPVAIIGLGINFILDPVGASTRFGIPIHDPAAFPFMWTKGALIKYIYESIRNFPVWRQSLLILSGRMDAVEVRCPAGEGDAAMSMDEIPVVPR